jgi:DNA-binding GntR family transcriptional regulator
MISGIDELSVVIAQHEGIVDAIEAGDLAATQSLMLEHLRRIFSYLGEAVGKYPEYFEDARKWAPAARELRGP